MVTDHQVAATQLSGAAIAGSLLAFAWKATGILHDARAFDGQAGTQTAGASKGIAGVVGRFVAWIAAAISHELRIRRDMRQLMTMDEHMLRDIGPTRPEIGGRVGYGRN